MGTTSHATTRAKSRAQPRERAGVACDLPAPLFSLSVETSPLPVYVRYLSADRAAK